MTVYRSRINRLFLSACLIAVMTVPVSGQDTSIVKGRHIVVTPLDQDIITTKTKSPETDRIFKNFTLPQIELILQKTQEKIKLSDEEEKRLSALLDQNNERFIQIFQRSKILDEILMRQAEILYDKVQTKFFEDDADYNRKLDAYAKLLDQYERKEISELPEQPKPAVKDFSKVIWLYDYVINEIPESKYVPDALYNKAYIYGREQQNSEMGIRTLEVLTRKYPNSRYVLESNWLIGEFLFNSSDDVKLRRARSHFQKVLELSAESEFPSRRFGESLYRLAWVSYKLRNFSDAIAYFTFLMDDIQQNKELFDGQVMPGFVKTEMLDEAAQYIGICFMDILKREYSQKSGNPRTGEVLDRLVQYFANFNPTKAYEPYVYERLGLSYSEVDEIKDEIYVYEYIVNRFPQSERAAALSGKIIELRSRELNALTGMAELTLREEIYGLRQKYWETYNYRSDWYKQQLDKFNRQNGPEADPSVKGTVDRYLNASMFTEVDSTSQKYFIDNMDHNLFYAETFNGSQSREGIVASQEQALSYYNRYANSVFQYFDFYSRYDSVAYENGYYLGLVLDQRLNRQAEAYPIYLEVSRNPFSEHHRFETALNAISIAQDQFKQEETTTPKIGLSSLSRAQAIVADSTLRELKFLAYVDTLMLTPGEKRLIESYDNFARLFPHISKTKDYVENISLLYFNKNQLDAVADWQVILQKYYPEKKVNPGYVTDLMTGYYQVKDYPSAEKLARALIYMKEASEKQKDYAWSVWSNSIGQYAIIMQDRKDYFAAAEQWFRIYQETPNYKEVDQAIYFAADNFDKIKEFNRSNELYNLLIEKFPKSVELVDNAHKNIYANYKEMGAFSLSSKQAERNYYYFAGKNEETLAEQYLYFAFDDAKKSRDLKEAFRLSELYVEKFPKSPFATEVLFGTIGLQSDLKDERGVFDAYGKFAAQYPDDFRTVEAFYRRGNYLERQQDFTGAQVEYQAAAQRNRDLKAKKLPGSPYFAGESLYKIGLELRRTFDDIKIDYANSSVTLDKKEAAKTTYWNNQIEIRGLSLEPGGSLYRAFEATYNIGRTQEVLSSQVGERNASDAGYRGADLIKYQSEVYYDAKSFYETAYQIYAQTYTSLKQFGTTLNTLLEQNKDSIATNDIVVPDSTLKLLATLDSTVSEKTSEMLFRAARAQHEVVFLFINDRSLLDSQTDPNVYLLIGAQLIDDVTPDIADAISLYRRNIDLSAERGVENHWVQESRQAITDLSDLQATRYVELVNYAINAFDQLFDNFRSKVEVNEEPLGDEILNQESIMNVAIESNNQYVTTTINSFAAALKVVDANNLGKDLRLQVENRATEFLLKTGDMNLERSRRLLPVRKQYDQVSISEPDKYWYLDATFTIDNIINTLKVTGLSILENGILFMNEYGVFTQWTGQIITRLIAVDPQTYGKLLGEIDLRGSLVFETDHSWRATTAIPENWFQISLDDSTWYNAEPTVSASGMQVDFFDFLSGPKSYVMQPVWYYRIDEGTPLESETDESGNRMNQFFFSSLSDTDLVIPSENQESMDMDTVPQPSYEPDQVMEPTPGETVSDTTLSGMGESFLPPGDSLMQVTQDTTFNTSPDTNQVETIATPVQAPLPPVILVRNRFDYPENSVAEQPDAFENQTVPNKVLFRKTMVIDGAIETATLVVGKNLKAEVYLNENPIDETLGELSADGKSMVVDVSKILNRGKNVLAVKTDATESYNKNLYALVNVTYYPDVPPEKVLNMFQSQNELPGVKPKEPEATPQSPEPGQPEGNQNSGGEPK